MTCRARARVVTSRQKTPMSAPAIVALGPAPCRLLACASDLQHPRFVIISKPARVCRVWAIPRQFDRGGSWQSCSGSAQRAEKLLMTSALRIRLMGQPLCLGLSASTAGRPASSRRPALVQVLTGSAAEQCGASPPRKADCTWQGSEVQEPVRSVLCHIPPCSPNVLCPPSSMIEAVSCRGWFHGPLFRNAVGLRAVAGG